MGSSGYLADRLLGGAFGFGLFDAIKAGYRWLALNYDPGDEIFVLGFSRGAYTARSLVGMIGRVGLLTRQALISDHLPEAVDRYRRHRPDHTSYHGASDKRFREMDSHPDIPVDFLGVFDTVGALGVPGAFRRRHQFHDVRLSDAVLCARQALAIDEHRIKFEPSLWEPPGAARRERRSGAAGGPTGQAGVVRGGALRRRRRVRRDGVSDTALGWMTDEAATQGLVFDYSLLDQYLTCGSPATRHNSTTSIYHVLNLFSRIRMTLRPPAGDHLRGARPGPGSSARPERPSLVRGRRPLPRRRPRPRDHPGFGGLRQRPGSRVVPPAQPHVVRQADRGISGRQEPVVARPS